MKERACVGFVADDSRAQDGSPCGELRTDSALCPQTGDLKFPVTLSRTSARSWSEHRLGFPGSKRCRYD